MKEGRIQYNGLNLGKLIENSYWGGVRLMKLDLKFADVICEMSISRDK